MPAAEWQHRPHRSPLGGMPGPTEALRHLCPGPPHSTHKHNGQLTGSKGSDHRASLPSHLPSATQLGTPEQGPPIASHGRVRFQGQSKTPNQMQTEATTENMDAWTRSGKQEQNSSTEARWPGSGPAKLTVPVPSLVPSSGPFALGPAASWAVPWGRVERGARAGQGPDPQQLQLGQPNSPCGKAPM